MSAQLVVRHAGATRARVPASWASAGIVDARAFTVGASTRVHWISSAWPNRVSGLCGVSAPLVEVDTPRIAHWADAEPDCAACVARLGGAR